MNVYYVILFTGIGVTLALLLMAVCVNHCLSQTAVTVDDISTVAVSPIYVQGVGKDQRNCLLVCSWDGKEYASIKIVDDRLVFRWQDDAGRWRVFEMYGNEER